MEMKNELLSRLVLVIPANAGIFPIYAPVRKTPASTRVTENYFISMAHRKFTDTNCYDGEADFLKNDEQTEQIL